MIKIDENEIRMIGTVHDISVQMLDALITFKQMLDENHPGVSGDIYDGIVVAGKYGDRQKANDYFAREIEKMSKVTEEALSTLRILGWEVDDDEADQC